MTGESEIRPAPAPWTLSAAIAVPVLLLCFIAAAVAVRRIAVLLLPGKDADTSALSSLNAGFAQHKILTLCHIVPALLLVAVLIVKVLGRNSLPADWQRKLSLALMALGVVVGATAILMSLHPFGGLTEASAALSYDALFLFSLGRAAVWLRRQYLSRYREWMVRAIAVLLGIATTRPVMGVFFATRHLTHLQPDQFFGIAFWIGFTLTYAAGELYLRLGSAARTPALPPASHLAR